MESPPRMKPCVGQIQEAGYKKQDIRYKDEGMQQDARFRGKADCDILIIFQETTRF
jgi:hypothetical protein